MKSALLVLSALLMLSMIPAPAPAAFPRAQEDAVLTAEETTAGVSDVTAEDTGATNGVTASLTDGSEASSTTPAGEHPTTADEDATAESLTDPAIVGGSGTCRPPAEAEEEKIGNDVAFASQFPEEHLSELAQDFDAAVKNLRGR